MNYDFSYFMQKALTFSAVTAQEVVDLVSKYVDIASLKQLLPNNLADLLPVGTMIPTNSSPPVLQTAWTGPARSKVDMDFKFVNAMVDIPPMPRPNPSVLDLTNKATASIMSMTNPSASAVDAAPESKPEKLDSQPKENESSSPIIDFFKNHYGKIGLAIAAAALGYWAYNNREKIKEVFSKVAGYFGINLDALVGSVISFGKSMWNRISPTKLPEPRNEFQQTRNDFSKIRVVAKRLGVSELAVKELMCLMQEVKLDEVVKVDEAERNVRDVKGYKPEPSWTDVPFVERVR